MKNIIIKKLNETQAITVLVLVKTGSRYEDDNSRGVAHFIEHLLFKGTKKRPSSLHITKELDGIGAEYNAFTSKDRTGYYIKASKENLELILDILSDMIFNSKFEEKEINRERGVILEEFNMYYDNPIMFIDSLLEQSIFEGHNLGNLVLGEKKVIKNISRAKILSFYKKYYQANNMVIGVAGNVEGYDLEFLLKKYFKITEFKQENKFKVFKGQQNKVKFTSLKKATDQIHMSLGFEGISYFDKDFYASKLLSIILGGNMSSRLFLKIREKLGLCYYIRAHGHNYQDTGAFSVTAGLDKNKIESAIKNILNEISKLKNIKVSKQELKRAKSFIKGKLVLRMEDSENVIDWYVEQLLLQNKQIDLEEIIDSFNKVSASDILRVAKKIFKNKKLNLAIIGDLEQEDKILKIINSHKI